MFVLGHLGIGSKIVSPLSKGLPRRALLWGTILPDLIDKPLYYVFRIMPGTRSIGHTAFLTIATALLATARRSRVLAALSLGMASHLLLDNITEYFLKGPHWANGATRALLWPWLGSFPVLPAQSLSEHLLTIRTPFLIGSEVLGALILAWDYWKLRRIAS